MFLRFADPCFLGLFILIPALVFWHVKRRNRNGATLQFSHLGIARSAYKPSAAHKREMLTVLRMLTLASLIFAFARPQSGTKGEEVLTQGIDIILAMDVSSSMLAEDLKPNRLEASKAVAEEFIKGRKNDRIGMVVFAGESYTQCPLTLDYSILLTLLGNLEMCLGTDREGNTFIDDGTAIGMGLATAANRLRTSQAKSKVIVLLTDGSNNAGQVDPITAAQIAQALDIRVYTIGAGTRGTAMYPVQDPFFGKRYVPRPVDIDEETLTKIAQLTGGQYFRATSSDNLSKVYHEIDAMEKTLIKVKEYTRYTELFYYFVGLALFFLTLEVILAHTRFRKIP